MHLRVLISALLAMLAQSCAGSGRIDADAMAELHCAPFEWTALEGVSDRAALILPASVNGAPARLQLDTAVGVSLLYGAPEDWPEVSFDNSAARASLRIGDIALGETVFVSRQGGEKRQGTLGLGALIGKIIVLDYPNQRFCVAEESAALMRQASFVPARLNHGMLWIPVEVSGTAQDGFFFDTGASMFALVTDLEQWRELTGHAPETADRVIQVNSWGQVVELRGSMTAATVRTAGVLVEDPLVYYMTATPTFFRDFGNRIGAPAEGLVGNAPFLQHVVVLDLAEGAPRFGLLRAR